MSSQLSDTSVHSGACSCQNVHFTVTGTPFTFYICHCKNCKKQSGSAFMANIFFMKEQVEILAGKDSIKEYADKDTDSGAPLTRSFCTNCGASLFIKSGVPEHANIVIVPTGLIEDTFEWVPKFENHAAEKRQWVKELEVITG